VPNEVVSTFHPPLQGEGRIAEGDPGWGTLNSLSVNFRAVRTPPGFASLADLPLQGR
jgi:hypothetical protein